MNKRQKEVQQTSLKDEQKAIENLKQAYRQASKDCEDAIAALNARTDMQNLQSIIYQKQYQEALKNQIDGILKQLQTNEFSSIAEYLTTCYENGYIGAMYDLQGQGIPITVPIDQTKVVKAVETDSQISTTMYKKLGEDVKQLKKDITSELSRGTASGKSWLEIANNIANGMNSPFNKARNNSIRIARTEGHRIQQASQLDACKEAKDNGADVVKQWDATLDSRTRPEHAAADGQIRELDDYFNVGGEKMEAPGIGGSARNVCNCRCCLAQRAKWALDANELTELQKRASYFGLDKTSDFEEYKQKYLKVTETTRRKIGDQGQEIIDKPTYNKLTKKFIKNGGIIIRGGDAKNHLNDVGAYASYVSGANTAFIKDDATVSDVLEEMFHAEQDRKGEYSKYSFEETRLRREIDAQNYLLNVAERYKIPVKETEVTKANLKEYEKRLETLLNGGG